MNEEMISQIAEQLCVAMAAAQVANIPVGSDQWFEALAHAAYNPNERLREALVALADAADKCSESPHFIVQPFLNVYREHGETIADARSALPQGED